MAAFMRRMVSCLLTPESRSVLTVKGNPGTEWRRYVRALRRRPVRVLFPDGEEEKPLKANQSRAAVAQQRGGTEKDTQSRAEAPSKAGPSRRTGTHSTTEDLLDGLRFDRAYAGDRRLGKAVSVARSRKCREQQGKVLLEGRRLICDALLAGAVPHTLFFSSVDQLRELPLDKLRRTSLIKVKPEDIQMWSDLVTPQGIIAIFLRPEALRLNFPQVGFGHSVPLSIICDNVRDPGNLGTILRCAAAAGCQNVLLTKGCVDVWEPKVLRAAMGAHFRLPIFPSLQWDDVPRHLPAVVTVHLADNCSAADDRHGSLKEVGLPKNTTPGKAEDYGWMRSRPCSKNAPHKNHPQDWDSDSDSESDEDEGGAKISLPKVESQLYYESWAENHTALVIGGETHGLSLEALQLAERTDGRRLFVPMVPGVDSLNSAMAASILLFEGRRQLLLSTQRFNSGADSKTQ